MIMGDNTSIPSCMIHVDPTIFQNDTKVTDSPTNVVDVEKPSKDDDYIANYVYNDKDLELIGEDDTENRINAQCRICLNNCIQNESHLLTSMYPHENEHDFQSLIDLISEILQIKMVTDELMPKYICGNCFHELTVTNSFAQKVKHSEKYLKQELERLSLSQIPTNETVPQENEGSNKKDVSCGTNNDLFNDLNQSETVGNGNFADILANIKVEPMDTEEIKKEVESDNDVDEVDMCPRVDHFGMENISIVPLSADVALQIHQQNKTTEKNIQISTSNGISNHSDSEEENENLNLTQEELSKYEVGYFGTTETSTSNLKSLSNNTVEDTEIHTCILCNQQYRSEKALKYHVEFFHNYCDPMKCEFCDELFSNLGEYSLHKETHSSKGFYCRLCHKDDFNSEKEWNKHVCSSKKNNKRIRKSKKYLRKSELDLSVGPSKRCSYCPLRFKCELRRLTHMERHTHKKEMKCNYCDILFTRSQRLNDHLAKVHGEVVRNKKKKKKHFFA